MCWIWEANIFISRLLYLRRKLLRKPVVLAVVGISQHKLQSIKTILAKVGIPAESKVIFFTAFIIITTLSGCVGKTPDSLRAYDPYAVLTSKSGVGTRSLSPGTQGSFSDCDWFQTNTGFTRSCGYRSQIVSACFHHSLLLKYRSCSLFTLSFIWS